MKIPKNMTKKEVIDKIQLVVDRIAPKYTFHGYDIDDMKQEAFIICIDALDRYDQKRPLENFLSVNLSNRLKNFVRDNYCTLKDVEKKKVMTPAPLISDNIVDTRRTDNSSKVNTKEASDIIDQNLPVELRADYLKMINDVYILKKKKDEILLVIKNILKEHGYDPEE
tara:strand:- start:1559 stop:2062 length:504 start_codon:yes stop_codon:yes gene_type:complete